MYRMCFYLLTLTFLTIMWSQPLYAAVFKVSNAADLSSALLAVQDNGENDTIRIAQGKYVGNFVYEQYRAEGDLTLEGGWSGDFAKRVVDADNTVLDGNNSGRVFYYYEAKGANLTLDGLTFTNGEISSEDDDVKYGGGGILIFARYYTGEYEPSNPGKITVNNCSFTDNSLAGGNLNGGGLFIFSYQEVEISNNRIANNLISGAGGRGGGAYIHSRDQKVDILSNQFTNNFNTDDSGYGGGLYLDSDSGQVQVKGNTVSGNNSSFHGGGMFLSIDIEEEYAVISENIISKNSSQTQFGGGVYLGVNGGQVDFINNQITQNVLASSGAGAGIAIDQDLHPNGDPSLINFVNNTISENHSANIVGGLYHQMEPGCTAHFYNNIFWDNSFAFISANPRGNDIYIWNQSATTTFFNNNFDQSKAGFYEHTSSPRSGNLDKKDPLFMAASKGNYSLKKLSPCFNTGNNRAPGLPSIDLNGRPRIQGGIVDMGAYERGTGGNAIQGVLTPLFLLLK